MSVRTWYFHLQREECETLLDGAAIGRLGVVVDGRPEIFPVAHVYDERTRSVAFPCRVGTKLQAALHWPYVAFEVDGLAPAGDGGWSVLVVGRAEAVDDPDEIARLGGRRSITWAAGRDVSWLRVVPSTVTGRRVTAQVWDRDSSASAGPGAASG